MLQSKYLTEDGLNAWFKECYTLGFKYVFYNPDSGIYMLSEREPVFHDTTFMYCDGKKYPLTSYFSTLVVKDILTDRNYIAIEDHIDCTDWSKVAVDTPILVSDHNYDFAKRHFARYENGTVYAWEDGYTSWTAPNDGSVTKWRYAKVAK